MSVDQQIADLVHDARVMLAEQRLQSVLESEHYKWSCCWLGRNAVFNGDGKLEVRVIRVLLLPAWIGVWLAITPVAATLHYLGRKVEVVGAGWGVLKAKRHEQPVYSVTNHSLLMLWKAYTDELRMLSSDDKVELLQQWLEVLEVEGVDVKQRVDEISMRHAKANVRSFEDESAPHFHFMPAIECLLQDLDGEFEEK